MIEGYLDHIDGREKERQREKDRQTQKYLF